MRVRVRSSLGSVTARVLFWASICFGQSVLSGTQETRFYSYGAARSGLPGRFRPTRCAHGGAVPRCVKCPHDDPIAHRRLLPGSARAVEARCGPLGLVAEAG